MNNESAASAGSAHQDVTVDLSGLQGTYEQRWNGRSRWVILGVATIGVVLAVPKLFSDSWFDRLLGLAVITGGLTALAMQLWRPPATVLSQDGVRVRKILIQGRLLPWRQIDQVVVQGRWQGNSSVSTHDGQTVPLLGLPLEDAQRLAKALQTARHSL